LIVLPISTKQTESVLKTKFLQKNLD